MATPTLDPITGAARPPGDPAPPPAPRRRSRGVASLLVAALLGGGVSAAAVTALDDDEGGTTTVTTTAGGFATASAPAASSPAPAAASSAGAKSMQQIYRDTKDGVVRVEQANGQGSGFVISGDGYILTNAHVVDGSSRVTVTFADKDRVQARIVGKDNGTDVALLKVDGKSGLKPVPLGASRSVQVGDSVVALGNPFGLDRTLTAGIISALDRRIQSPNGFTLSGAIQTDAAINHGNSGGPLLNGRGEVIGINAQIANSGVNAYVGVGFAIPIDTAREVADELRQSGQAKNPWLGVALSPVDETLAERENLGVKSGAMVERVTRGGPAGSAGVRAATRTVTVDGQEYAVGGDIIVGVDGKPIGSVEELQAAIAAKEPGDKVTLDVRRDNGRTAAKVEVTLGDQRNAPASDQRGQPDDDQQPNPRDPNVVPPNDNDDDDALPNPFGTP
jgi:S1-C subfamily serine protease